MRAMGIDVSLTRGHDVVVIDDSGKVEHGPLKIATGEVGAVIREAGADVVAVDAPPAWAATGTSRAVERQLASLGIAIFATPSDPRGRPFYKWMEEGFKVFAAAAAQGYSLYRGRPSPGRHAIEVFPHATACALRGCLPRAARKIDFRRDALVCAGVQTEKLDTQDEIDAGLAALTGIKFLQDVHGEVGLAGEAVLVIPRPVRIRLF